MVDYCRFPAQLYPHFGPCLKIWLLARTWDDSRETHWHSKGSGKATFSLLAAKRILNRGFSTIRRYLAQAHQKGLIRCYRLKGDWVEIYYASLERAARAAGLDAIGPIADINLEQLEDLNIIATEVEADALQRESFYAAKLNEQERLKEKNQSSDIRMTDPMTLIAPTCGRPARVLGWINDRWVLVSEGFIPYGGSQKAIASRRGVSPRTINRHLSNRYRLQPSPIRDYRAGVAPVLKRQIAQRMRSSTAWICRQFERGRVLEIGSRYFYARVNIYALPHELIPSRFRRRAYKKVLWTELEKPPERVK